MVKWPLSQILKGGEGPREQGVTTPDCGPIWTWPTAEGTPEGSGPAVLECGQQSWPPEGPGEMDDRD